MPDRDADPLIVAISSRTLFDMEDSHALFEREGIDAYADFQRTHEDDVLEPGVAWRSTKARRPKRRAWKSS
jgi:5'-nucleotidase